MSGAVGAGTPSAIRRRLQAHVGSLQQVAYARPVEYQEGRAHGLKAIEVKNGPMRFVSMADKAMDVAELEYKGTNLTFLSKPGLNGRNQFDTNGGEAQRSIMGGLFFTCGFENIGAPVSTDGAGGRYPAGDFPMHGRIRTTPAEHVGSDARWEGDDYVIKLSGEMRESELFGGNLVLRRRIRTVLGSPRIEVEDEVTNEGFRPEPFMMMMHCNIGWPLLAEGAEVVLPSRRATPRNEDAERDLDKWSCIDPPEDNRPEAVFLHTLAAGESGRTFAAVVNRDRGLGLRLDFSTADWPWFMQWRSMASGDYVIGLEPANSAVHGRAWHERRGDLHLLEPGASERKKLAFTVLDGASAIEKTVAERDALLRG